MLGALRTSYLFEKLGGAATGADQDVLSREVRKRVQAAEDEGRSVSDNYLWRVAYSVVVDEIRRRRKKEDERPLEAEPLTDERTPEDRARGRELGQMITAEVQELPAPRRTAVLLHLVGHSNPEIAELLGWERKRVENLVYRGLRDLRDRLRAKGVEP